MEISHVMSGTIFCVCSTFAISPPSTSVKAMSKRTQEDASRCRVRDPTVLASTASENPGSTKFESQDVPRSSLNVQQTGTERRI